MTRHYGGAWESMNDETRCCSHVLALLALGSGCGRRAMPADVAQRSVTLERYTIPAATIIAIRTVSRIDSRSAIPAEGFPAVITGNVNEDILSGSPVKLVILPGELGLGAVMVRGRWLPSSGKLGTLTRGVIDTTIAQPRHNESMAIQTSGEHIQVPAGTLLMFRLDEAVTVGSPEL